MKTLQIFLATVILSAIAVQVYTLSDLDLKYGNNAKCFSEHCIEN
jgi:hypothetical protein